MSEENMSAWPGEVTYSARNPGVEAQYVPLPAWLSGKTISLLSESGIHLLYSHQRQALEHFFNNENVVISTGTASGKSLCYQIPLMEMLNTDPKATAILIFPTKALTQDQYKSLLQFFPENNGRIAVYDGDTPKAQRTEIRKRVRVLLTNPDMLHLGIMPYHPGWSSFFENLKIIVLDEIHIYTGVFGSHIANVLRRIKRIAAHYHADPRFIFCSATLSNGLTLAEKLAGENFKAVTEDRSGHGSREITFLNPPIINEEFQLRAGSIYTAAKTAKKLLEKSRQVLLFCQSRQSVEFTVRNLRDHGVDASGYRSGYLDRERRTIESDLKSGKARCIAATNALELGMDIGGIDAVISIGYPGSVSALTQRQGRAGRRSGNSSFFLIASQTPTDQYIIQHPDFLFDKHTEPVLIDPDNLIILLQHMQCSLFEVPFSERESYGSLSYEETRDLLNYFVSEGIARLTGGYYYWLEGNQPQATVSLRNASLNRISIVKQGLTKPELIGEVDESSAYWMVHPGAVYYHNGVSYLIEDLDLETKTAKARQGTFNYSTEAQKESHITVTSILSRTETQGANLYTADVTVKSRVISYKKTDNQTRQSLGIYPLDLPEETLETTSFIFVIKETLRDQLRDAMSWTSDPNDYGPEWPAIRAAVIARDGEQCRVCHTPLSASRLHVHHIVPFRTFADKRKAHAPENLVTLCPDCHRRVEMNVQIRSGLAGYAEAFHQITALFLECAPGDLSVVIEPECTDFDGLPAIFLHENVPGGLGLSQAISEKFSEINRAVIELIEGCPCQDGCPGCVGAGGENGTGGKAEALAICRGIEMETHE